MCVFVYVCVYIYQHICMYMYSQKKSNKLAFTPTKSSLLCTYTHTPPTNTCICLEKYVIIRNILNVNFQSYMDFLF